MFNLQNFQCILKNQPVLRRNNFVGNTCPQNTKRFEIGFQIPTVLGSFVHFAELCYDSSVNSTENQYTIHTIYGQTINNKMSFSGTSFRKEFLNKNIQDVIDQAYRVDNQQKRFPNHAISNSSERFYAKGHLIPDADGITRSMRDATYYYMNAVPQWQKINNGIWKTIERKIRELAGLSRNHVKVYTGTIGSLGLLSDQGVNIPKWMYKVVIRPESATKVKAGISFMTLNDITATTIPPLPCTDVCNQHGFLQGGGRFNLNTGFTICCIVQDFQRNVMFLHINETNLKILDNIGS